MRLASLKAQTTQEMRLDVGAGGLDRLVRRPKIAARVAGLCSDSTSKLAPSGARLRALLQGSVTV